MAYNNSFLNIRCLPNTLDRYIVRKGILFELKSHLPDMLGVLLDIGCGKMPYKRLVTSPPSQVTKYISLDFENNPIHKNSPDITWQNNKIPLADNTVDCALCTEVLEHCPDPQIVLNEIYRVLKPNGLLFFTVPFLWPLHEVPYDYYRYTPFALQRHLNQCGFNQIAFTSLGGWDASLAQMLGLWVRRRPMKWWLRKCLSLFVWPLVFLLSKLDSDKPVSFKEGNMLTGIAGTARKCG